MMSIADSLVLWSSLLAVELVDERLAHRDVDVLAVRDVADGDGHALVGRLEPRGRLAVDRVEVVTDDDHPAGLVAQLDGVALLHLVARDRHPATVDVHMPVANELAGLAAARAPTRPVGDIVESLLEHAE